MRVDRRAPATVTAGDEVPMKFHETKLPKMARKSYTLDLLAVLGLRCNHSGRPTLLHTFSPPRHLRAGFYPAWQQPPRVCSPDTRGWLLRAFGPGLTGLVSSSWERIDQPTGR
jgi:hypothetical protein